MNIEISNEIKSMAEPERLPFQQNIVNSRYPVLGSTVGNMRLIAKKYKDTKVTDNEDEFYEELLVRGFIIAYNKRSILDKKDEIENYLAKVDSWALVDSFCSTFKVKKNEEEELFKLLCDYLTIDDEMLQRYALVMLLSHFLKLDLNGKKLKRSKVITIKDLENSPEGKYIDTIIEIINKEYNYYYSSMGAAWLCAEAFLFYPDKIIKLLKSNSLDSITHNRIIQKIVESRNPNKEVKELIKTYKRM